MEVTRNTCIAEPRETWGWVAHIMFRIGWRVENELNCVTGMAGLALNAGRKQITTKCELNSSQIMATAKPLLTGFFVFSKLILAKS